jgi:hypothetical protein
MKERKKERKVTAKFYFITTDHRSSPFVHILSPLNPVTLYILNIKDAILITSSHLHLNVPQTLFFHMTLPAYKHLQSYLLVNASLHNILMFCSNQGVDVQQVRGCFACFQHHLFDTPHK